MYNIRNSNNNNEIEIKNNKTEEKKKINYNHLNDMYNEAKKRSLKQKETLLFENKVLKSKQNFQSNFSSNKLLYNKFKLLFTNSIKEINSNDNDLNYDELKQLFVNINFINDNNNNKENELLKIIFGNLKNENDNLIKITHIFIFCLCIVNLFEFYLLNNYKDININNLNNNYNIEGENSLQLTKIF